MRKKPFINPGQTAVIAGIFSSAAYAYLALNSQHYGQATLWQLLCVSVICAALCFYTWFSHERHQQLISVTTLIGFALIFRVIGLLTFPILEDDFYRYLLDARNIWELGSPYDIAPADFFASSELSDKYHEILDGINHPSIATIYGPSCQWLFALAYAISPGEVWPLKLLLALIDMVTIAALLKLAKPNLVLLYAWSPLVIKEFSITAHPDLLGASLVVAALLMYRRQQFIWVGVCMALAAGVKIFALILLPFILRFYWRAWASFISTAILIALPFGIQQAWIPSGLSAMSSDWLFNAPIYILFGTWFSLNSVKIFLLVCLAIIAGWYLVSEIRHDLKHGAPKELHTRLRGDLLLLGLFACSPALNAWYLVWLLPFAVFRPSVWAWLGSLTILLSYASGLNLQASQFAAYEIANWVVAIEFLIPLLVSGIMVAYGQQLLRSK